MLKARCKAGVGLRTAGSVCMCGTQPTLPHWAVVSRGNKGVEQAGGGVQETPGGGAKTSKVAAIMAADGHWRALSTKWHYVKTEQEVKAG